MSKLGRSPAGRPQNLVGEEIRVSRLLAFFSRGAAPSFPVHFRLHEYFLLERPVHPARWGPRVLSNCVRLNEILIPGWVGAVEIDQKGA